MYFQDIWKYRQITYFSIPHYNFLTHYTITILDHIVIGEKESRKPKP